LGIRLKFKAIPWYDAPVFHEKEGKRLRLSRLIGVSIGVFLMFTTVSPIRAAVDPSYEQKLGKLVEHLKIRGLSEEELYRVFSDSRVTLYPGIVERSGKGLNYKDRRFGLLTKKSVKQGKIVLRENGRILKKIEGAYGVGREILVAILRIETNFGRVTGNYPVFNSLLTMSLLDNRRSAWAEDELGHLLLMCQAQSRDPLSVKGSWAGAFGIPQFVPSSYRKYGADGNGDGVVDLHNLADSLASIANYLKSFGWSRNNAVNKKKAVYAYNHCDQYVDAVFAYARAIRK
jgi:membrane-bound lytic murein transglycosylase B